VDDHLSGIRLTANLKRPTRESNEAGNFSSLFGLAPDGVYRAPGVTDGTVGSYPTFSPLPASRRAVCFLWHFPWVHTPLMLWGVLPCGVRTFLIPLKARRDHLPYFGLLSF